MSNAFDEIPNDLVKILRFFVNRKNFSYVDRIGNTLSPEAIEMALKDALRDLNSFYLSAQSEGGGPRFIRERDGSTTTLPNIPSQDSIKKFLQLVQEDVSYGRRLAMLALSWSTKSEKSSS